MPLTEGCYEALGQQHTTLPLTPAEVHEIGLAEIERIDAEIAELGEKLFVKQTLHETLRKLELRSEHAHAAGELPRRDGELLALPRRVHESRPSLALRLFLLQVFFGASIGRLRCE